MAQGGLLAGVLSITIAGTSYEVVDGVNYGLSTVERETLKSISGISGYKETPIAGFIEAKLRDNSSIKAGDFQAMTNVNVVVAVANGKAISGSNMWNVKAVEVDPIEGVFDVRFESTLVKEV
jgi:hypothetical protein